MSLDIVCRCNVLRHANIERTLSGWWNRSESNRDKDAGYEPGALPFTLRFRKFSAPAMCFHISSILISFFEPQPVALTN